MTPQDRSIPGADFLPGSLAPLSDVDLPAQSERTAPADWYPDPKGEARLRYWDGTSWTKHTSGVPDQPPVRRQQGRVHPADWYPDPKGEARLRYWDGASWTEHTAGADATVQPTPATMQESAGRVLSEAKDQFREAAREFGRLLGRKEPDATHSAPSANNESAREVGGSLGGQVKGPPSLPPTSHAIALMRGGQVDAGRMLIERICQERPQDTEAWVVAAWEWTRHDPTRGRQQQVYLEGLRARAGGSCEHHSVMVLLTYHLDIERAMDEYRMAKAAEPRTKYGLELFRLADIAHDDALYQVLCTPTGENVSTIQVTPRTVGLVALTERKHDMALDTFLAGVDDASTYMRRLRTPLDAHDVEILRIGYAFGCRMGVALTLWDMGRDVEAETAWHDAWDNYRREKRRLSSSQ